MGGAPAARGWRLRAVDLVDVFAYLVVLGLFVQFLPMVISESFGLSLLTAVLLKAVLEVVVQAKKAIMARSKSAGGQWSRIAVTLALVALSASSKFLVLSLTDLIFGDAVQLGGFFSLTLLVVVLMVARARVRLLLTAEDRLDEAQ